MANYNVNRYIQVTFQKEGIHCYPAAGLEPALKEVQFLAYPHRHIFHFKVTVGVTHNDRDIEFIILKRWMESLYSDSVINIDYKSCEMLAEDLIGMLRNKYGDRYYRVEVFEDNENGGIVEYVI